MFVYSICFVLLSCCSYSVWSVHQHHDGGYHCDRHYGGFSIQSISSRNLSYGYSPFWDKKTQSLYFVDFDSVDVPFFRYDFKQKILYAASLDNGWTDPSFLIPFKGSKNQFLTTIQRTLVIIEWDGVSPKCTYVRNATSVETDPIYAGNRLDSGKVDPKGRLFAGTYRADNCAATSNAYAALYLFEKNLNIETLISNTTSATGLAFNKKEKLFYFIDVCSNVLLEFDWIPSTGQIRNRRTVFTFPAFLNLKYALSGLDIDRDGNLYVGLYRASAILKINPCTGIAERMIHLPVETPTAICWGGPNLDIMFVTTSTIWWDFNIPETTGYPLAPSPLRGQVLMIKKLHAKGVHAGKRITNYFT